MATNSDKRERTHRAILAATARLIGHAAGMDIRIEQICAEAGVSRGTFYNYFQSVDEVLAALTQVLNHNFNMAILDQVAAGESRAEGTYLALTHFLDRASRDPAWGWTMLHLSVHGPLFGEDASAAALASIERGMAAGEFDITDAAFGRDMALGTCLAAIRSQLHEKAAYCRPQDAARYILRGLGVPEGRIEEIVSKPVARLDLADFDFTAGD